MPEVQLDAAIAERLTEARRALTEIMKDEDQEGPPFDYMANVVSSLGLDLMMVDFFRRLDEDTLRRSAEQFFQQYPHCEAGEPVELSDNPLVNLHAELSRRYPKQFFAFVLEKLKTTQWAAARDHFERLFPKYGPQRNGESH
jgi:hypothetical protein